MTKKQIVFAAVLVASATIRVPDAVAGCRSASGFQEYFVLGREDQVYAMFIDVAIGEGVAGSISQGAMESVVTLSATTDAQSIHYDHWEDGYDDDPFNPGPTTEVYNLDRGEALSLRSDGSGPGLQQAVPALRGTELRYDGGDRVVSTGGPVGLVHSMWPLNYAYIGGAIELYARQAVDRAYAYVVPVGVDSYDGTAGHFAPFKYVWLQVEAFEDDTDVRIQTTLETVFIHLDKGQTYSTRGAIGDVAAPPIVVRQGTQINAAKPIQASIVTASDGNFQARFYTLLPQRVWERDYITALAGPANPTRPANVYLFNPGSQTINVTAYDSVEPAGHTFSIAAGAAAAYSQPTAVNRLIPAGSPVRFTSPSIFWGVVASDYTSTSSDWGVTLLPTSYLSDNVTASWSPGADDQVAPPGADVNASPIHVMPVADGTIVCADLDGDGLADDVDTDGNGVADPGNADYDGNGLSDAGCYTTNLFAAPRGLRIFDPIDLDNTGTHIFATHPFTACYGQDADVAVGSNPAELDLGFNVMPSDQRFLQPVITVDATSPNTTVFDSGGDVVIQAQVRSYELSPIEDVGLEVALPTGITYLPGSTSIVVPAGPPVITDPTVTTTPAGTRLAWASIATLGPASQIRASFTVRLSAALASGRHNVALEGLTSYNGVSFRASDCIDLFKTWGRLIKTASIAQGGPGDLVQYNLAFDRSTSATSPDRLGRLVVRDVLPNGVIYIPGTATYALSSGGSGPGAYNPATRTLSFPEFDSVRSTSQNLTANFTFLATIEAEPRLDRVCNEGELGSLTAPPDLPNLASAKACIDILRPSLVLAKSAPATVAIGQRFTYTLSVSNTGSAVASALVIDDRIPAEVTYIADSMRLTTATGTTTLSDVVDGDGGSCDGTSLRVTVPNINAGEVVTVTFEVRAPSTPNVFIANVALVDAGPISPTYTNLTVTVTGRSGSTVRLTDSSQVVVASYRVGDDVYVGVVDPDQNVDPMAGETVSVSVTDPATGDVEVMVLTEVTTDTSTFFGGPLTTRLETASPVLGDGVLEVRNGSQVVASYVDPVDAGDTAQDDALLTMTTPSTCRLVDPGGAVWLVLQRDDVVHVRVTDGDENRNVTASDSVTVTLRSTTTGDSETLVSTETGASNGIFLTLPIVTVAPATATPVADDGVLETFAGDLVVASYVDPDDAADSSSDTVPVSGVNLLRNDALTSIRPLAPALSTLFAAASDPSLDGRGANARPDVGEGASTPLPGSSDDDDFYLALATSPVVDPDSGLVGDASRPLVFYQTDVPGNTLKLIRQGLDVRLAY